MIIREKLIPHVFTCQGHILTHKMGTPRSRCAGRWVENVLKSDEKNVKNRKLIFLRPLAPRIQFPAKVHVHTFAVKKIRSKTSFSSYRSILQKMATFWKKVTFAEN